MRLEAYLVLAGILAAMAWYAGRQLHFSLAPLEELFRKLIVGGGG